MSNLVNAVSRGPCFHDSDQGRSSQIRELYEVSVSTLSLSQGLDIACSTACTMYNQDLATKIGPEVENALAGTDTSNLKASFRRTLSSSIPPPALYRNYRLGGYSNLVFGVPLQECMTDGDHVPKVIRMCIEEVERRGLDTHKIYSVSLSRHLPVQLRRKLESEQTFYFSYSDNIHSVATLLKLYLWDLPEPLCTLPLRDYIQYGQNKVRYTENNFSLLRSKIRELPEVHRITLGTLCLHLARVASHSEKNAMTADALALMFGYCVFNGSTMLPGARDLLMEDLIQNAHTLFGEHLSPSSPPSIHPEGTASVLSFNSCLSPQSTEAQVAGPSAYLRPEPVGSAHAYGRYSPSISHSNSSAGHLGGATPTTLTPLLPETRGFKSAKALPNTPLPPTSVAEHGVQQTYPEAQSPQESLPSSLADQTFSSGTSLRSTLETFH
ncbi:Rho GTPase activation protein [Lactarius deliciosus]|nr:Rho GTPase activation protein [Lactarius deliciosus]